MKSSIKPKILEILLFFINSSHPSAASMRQWMDSALFQIMACGLFGTKPVSKAMGLLPDTWNCGCACAGNAGNVFPVTAGERSRHASRHVRDARAVMHAGIANYRFPLKSAAGENVPGIPGACATCNFTYLVRGPCCVIVDGTLRDKLQNT